MFGEVAAPSPQEEYRAPRSTSRAQEPRVRGSPTSGKHALGQTLLDWIPALLSLAEALILQTSVSSPAEWGQ